MIRPAKQMWIINASLFWYVAMPVAVPTVLTVNKSVPGSNKPQRDGKALD